MGDCALLFLFPFLSLASLAYKRKYLMLIDTGVVQTDDKIWAVVFTTSPAQVELHTSENRKETFQVGAGMTKLSCNQELDGGMRGTIIRNGQVVAECNPIGFRFDSRPGVHNFNAAVAMSY